MNYLIFFGKSQSFKFLSYDESGLVVDFEKVIRDFDELESKWFTVDATNNKAILSRDEFMKGGTKFSLLKLYSHAQAAEGTRVEGSIYGVAFLSNESLKTSSKNLQLLQTLKEKFAEMSLVNLKFKKSDFEKEATLIWKAFRDQIGFDKIERAEFAKQNFESERPTIVYLKPINGISDIKFDGSQISTEVYFSEDLEHIERWAKKWGTKLTILTNSNGQLKPLQVKDNVFIERREKISGNEGSNLRINELERELLSTKKRQARDNKNHKKISLIGAGVIFVLLCICVFLFLRKPEPIIVEKPPAVLEVIKSDATSSLSFSEFLIDSILIDTNRVSKLLPFLKQYKSTYSSHLPKNWNANFKATMNNAQDLKLDTGRVSMILNSYKKKRDDK